VKVAFAVGLLVFGAVLAGCSTPRETATTCGASSCNNTDCLASCAPVGDMVISGLVESNALVPLAGANVTISPAGLQQVTDQNGRFAFPGLAPGVYRVGAVHNGFALQYQDARPEATSLQFILDRAQPTQPYNVTLPPLHGFLECASEELIGSGPCDLYVQFAGGPAVFQNQSAFPFQTDLGWKTIVMDLTFDAANNPGIDGMRETLRAANGTAALNTYQQYGRFHGSQSFSTRIEPGGNYTDGDAPVPANVTAFKLEVYPQGRGYHTVCTVDVPGHPAECFTGVGAAANLRFDLYITIFYVDPAPAGFTLLR